MEKTEHSIARVQPSAVACAVETPFARVHTASNLLLLVQWKCLLLGYIQPSAVAGVVEAPFARCARTGIAIGRTKGKGYRQKEGRISRVLKGYIQGSGLFGSSNIPE